jgi:hypothetical protein
MLFKKIKRSVFTLVLLAVPFLAFSQKLEKPTIDKFSNETIYTTTTEKIATTEKFSSTSASLLYAYATKIKGIIFIDFKLEVSVDQPDCFLPKGKKVLLKLADNSTIELVNDTDFYAHHQDIKNGFIERTYWVATPTYLISPDNLSKLTSTNITAIRFEAITSVDDFDVTTKEAAVIKKMFTIISGAGN